LSLSELLGTSDSGWNDGVEELKPKRDDVAPSMGGSVSGKVRREKGSSV